MLLVLGMGVLVTRRRPAWALPALILTALAIGGYLGFRAYGKQVALDLVQRSDPSGEMAALPHGLSPFLWDVIVKGRGYTAHVIDARRGRVLESRVIPSADEEPVVVRSKRSALVRVFLRRARFPVVAVLQEGNATRVMWHDVHLMISGGAVQGVVVVLNERGKILEERFELNIGDWVNR